MSSASFILGFFKVLIFRQDILKMLKKRISLIWPPKRTSIPSFQILDLKKKKVDKYPVSSTINVAKKRVNS
jgi:hypothetical protein